MCGNLARNLSNGEEESLSTPQLQYAFPPTAQLPFHLMSLVVFYFSTTPYCLCFIFVACSELIIITLRGKLLLL